MNNCPLRPTAKQPRHLFVRNVARSSVIFCLLGAAIVVRPANADNWPQWRGPQGNGICRERETPLIWNEERGLAWKCPLPAWGNSTPAVWEDRVFVTSHTDDRRLELLCIDARSGKPVWTRQVGTATAPREAPPRKRQQKFHRLHNLASPSPITDGKTVVVHFGNGDLAAYDFQGRRLWYRNLQEDYGPYSIWWGHANSPVIYQDLVISVCMQDSLADVQETPVESYVVAHDLKTGKVRWRTTRATDAQAEECDAYTTPVFAVRNGLTELIIMGGNQLDAYDPKSGRQLWFLPGLVGGRTVTGPVVDQRIVYVTRGKKGPFLAVARGGQGELTRRSIVWFTNEGTPDSCSPIVVGNLLFLVSDDGIARCYDKATGELFWKKRLPGKYKASPVAVDGRLLFLNTDGTCTVVSASSRYNKLAENRLDDQTLASPAIANRHIYIRGHQSLYCIGQKR